MVLHKTRPESFEIFYRELMSDAPEGYVPWFFPVQRGGKAPDSNAISLRSKNVCLRCNARWIKKGKKIVCSKCEESRASWKSPHARLSFDEAIKRLQDGGNLGLAARADDPLVIIDIDDLNYEIDLPNTLTEISRKRVGFHAFCWDKDKSAKVNIPTDHGEVRSCDQYVVCSGSYCYTSEDEIDKEPISPKDKEIAKNDPDLGSYTPLNIKSPITITYEEFPDFFKKVAVKIKKHPRPCLKNITIASKGNRSALFDLSINNIVSISEGKPESHPLHGSKTGTNFSISNGLGHCWRHNVSLNALQFLCVKSGYLSCEDAGTKHKSAGSNSLDDGAIFHAWVEAKNMRIIPRDDPIPTRAMNYVAKKYELVSNNHVGLLRPRIYNKVLKILEEKY
jgi:putative DNA primase/helicase